MKVRLSPTREFSAGAAFALAVTVLLALVGLGGSPAQPAAAAANALISQSRPVTASSIESAQTPAGAVNDGDLTTRWASAWSDPQWIQIDLGGTASISQVVLHWEAAYASAFQLQVSPDAAMWTPIYSTSTATGGVQTLNVTGSGRYIRMLGTTRATGYGYSLYEFQVYGSVTLSTQGYVPAVPQVTGVTPSTYVPPNAYFHEFQANCSASHDLMDDPIVHPGMPGASHMHTFLGNTTTDANSTLASLSAGGTACKAPGDKSGYWMPTLYNGTQAVDPVGPQVIYYKTGVIDYTSVRPFPAGLRFVVGSPSATATDFAATQPGLGGRLGVRQQLQHPRLPGQLPGRNSAQHPLPGSELLERAVPGHARPQEPHGLPDQRGLPGRPPGRAADDRVQDGLPGQW